jgi:hypothetical protein
LFELVIILIISNHFYCMRCDCFHGIHQLRVFKVIQHYAPVQRELALVHTCFWTFRSCFKTYALVHRKIASVLFFFKFLASAQVLFCTGSKLLNFQLTVLEPIAPIHVWPCTGSSDSSLFVYSFWVALNRFKSVFVPIQDSISCKIRTRHNSKQFLNCL